MVTDRRLLRLGTSSFSEKDWVGPFYPEGMKPGEFLSFYASHFRTVEIDATYYAVPAAATVDKWSAMLPDDFIVSAKFPRAIVHAGEGPRPDATKVLTPDATYGVRDLFLETMSRLGPKLGPLLIQFPYFNRQAFPSAVEFYDKLERFLADLPNSFRYAVEMRNRHWLKQPLVDMLRNHDVGLVLVDHGWMPPGYDVAEMFDPITTDFCYVRLLGDRKEIEAITRTWDREVIDHGPRLERWAEMLTRLMQREIPCLVYINNHYAGHAPETARRLDSMIADLAG